MPAVVRQALAAASDAPGYPLTAGTAALRAAIAGLDGPGAAAPTGRASGVLPTIGSKELVAWLPTLLGLGPGDTVVIPAVCYPTYEVGARLAGATVVADRLADRRSARTAGAADLDQLARPTRPGGCCRPSTCARWSTGPASAARSWPATSATCRSAGTTTPVSVLSPDVCGGDYDGLLAVHSLSKRSNLAGYRAGFVAGDPALVGELLAVRKHAGMIVPAPVQAAMVAALGDERTSRSSGRATRRAVRRCGRRCSAAGFAVEHSEAGLYLWATRGEDCWATVDWLAERGILVAPGAVLRPGRARHVRVALTATDERVAAAVDRLGP